MNPQREETDSANMILSSIVFQLIDALMLVEHVLFALASTLLSRASAFFSVLGRSNFARLAKVPSASCFRCFSLSLLVLTVFDRAALRYSSTPLYSLADLGAKRL
ncbi:MAG: hypothetical protein CSA65_02735 [Proteobacteria bacterium]|nr:MAG: hypothetical protein CSA65_02735 [Pseudomonadota bacterium]